MLVPGFLRTEGAQARDRERAREAQASRRDGLTPRRGDLATSRHGRGYCVARGCRRLTLMRVILFTGKGGVGKTTVAAATAVRAAREGKRTLVMSTDPAHSLGDSFEVEIESQPTLIADEPLGAADRRAGAARGQLARDPGLLHPADELGRHRDDPGRGAHRDPGPRRDLRADRRQDPRRESGTYDMLVVDCAPTAETLRLLSLPEIMNWYIERIFPVERKRREDRAPDRLEDDDAADRGRPGVRGRRAAAPQPRRREDRSSPTSPCRRCVWS